MQTIGEILRAKREEKNLLLRQVSALLDIDQAILSKIERGERPASKEIVVKLAEIYKINRDELISQFISEKIAYEIYTEKCALHSLKLAEKKIKYLKSNKDGKI